MRPRQTDTLAGFGARAVKILRADPRRRLLLSAVVSLGCNFLYALYHGILGLIYTSLWFVAMCAFYSILAVMRFGAVMCSREMSRSESAASERFVLRASGAMLILLSTVLAWVNSISLSQNIAAAYGTITMITLAAYTFYRLAAVIIRAVRQRRNRSYLFVALRNISCAEAAASILTLQRSMLVSFEGMDQSEIRTMNMLTGAAVFLFILALGILMIVRQGKENELWQTQNS